MIDDDVQRWLDSYIAAWRSYDPAAIGELFSEEAEYRYHPWGEPIRGRADIVKAWVAPNANQSQRDAPDTWEARYEPYAVDGDRAVAVGWSRYFAVGDTRERQYQALGLRVVDPRLPHRKLRS